MINKINKNKELNHFQDLSNQWWNSEGKFKILHSITPLRIYYIKKNVINSHKIKYKKKPLFNLSILDLGCGGGLVCEPLARLGANVTGVDFVTKNIEVAKKHALKSNLNIQYIKQNLSSLHLKNKYDVILLLEVIEHLASESGLKFYYDSLRNDGLIAISVPNKWWIFETHGAYLPLLTWNRIPFFSWLPKSIHSRFAKARIYRKKDIRIILGNAGFEILNNHAPIISALTKGDIKIITADNKIETLAINGGVIEMQNNKIIVLAN